MIYFIQQQSEYYREQSRKLRQARRELMKLSPRLAWYLQNEDELKKRDAAVPMCYSHSQRGNYPYDD